METMQTQTNKESLVEQVVNLGRRLLTIYPEDAPLHMSEHYHREDFTEPAE